MRFNQAIVHNQIGPFRKPFNDRWNFKEYKDPKEPLVMFGYLNQDWIYENHKGYKLIIPSNPVDMPNFENLTNHDKTIFVGKLYGKDKKLIEKYPQIVFMNKEMEIKDYSIFKPNILGDKIYYYSGFKNGWSGWGQDIIREIQKNIDFEIITTEHNYRNEYYDENLLKKNYYDKIFLNLNFSIHAGMTTVRETGLMGRKTITMRDELVYGYDCIINCNSIDNVIKNINEESKKIGTIQPSMDSHTIGDEWLNVEYWVNKCYE